MYVITGLFCEKSYRHPWLVYTQSCCPYLVWQDPLGPVYQWICLHYKWRSVSEYCLWTTRSLLIKFPLPTTTTTTSTTHSTRYRREDSVFLTTFPSGTLGTSEWSQSQRNLHTTPSIPKEYYQNYSGRPQRRTLLIVEGTENVDSWNPNWSRRNRL